MPSRSVVLRCAALSVPASLSLALPALAAEPLEAAAASPSQVVVVATRSPQQMAELVADVSVLDRAELDRAGVAALADVLARLPGLEIARNGGGGATTSLFVRGGESNHVAVFIDGVRLDSQSASGGAEWAMVPLALIDRVEVLRGPAATVYGSDAMAGVVQIFTKRGSGPAQPFVTVGAGTQGLGQLQAGVSGAGEAAGLKLDYALGGVLERSSGFNAKSTASANPDDDGYRRQGVNAKLGVDLAPGQRLQASVLAANTNSDYDGSATVQDHSFYQLRVAGLGWTARWNEAFSTQLQLSDSTALYRTDPSFYETVTHLRDWLLQGQYTRGMHSVSAQLQRRDDVLDNAAVGSTPALNRSRGDEAFGLGYGLQWQGLTLQARARHDQDSVSGGHDTGSLGLGAKLAPQWRATASVATAFRAPTVYQQYSIYGPGNLNPQRSRNAEAGLAWQGEAADASLVVYRNRVSDLIAFTGFAGTSGPCVKGSSCYQNVQNVVMRGATLSGSAELARWKLRGSLDVADPHDLSNDRLLARRAHQHASLSAETVLRAVELGGEVQLSSARYDYNSTPATRMPGYGLLGVWAATALAPEWKLQARVDNLGDHAYQLANGYNTPGRVVSAQLTWTPK